MIWIFSNNPLCYSRVCSAVYWILTDKILPAIELVLGEAGHTQVLEVDMYQGALGQLLLHSTVRTKSILVSADGLMVRCS